MSIKIHNAYVYRGPSLSGVKGIFDLSWRIQSKMKPLCERMFHKKAAGSIAYHLDRAVLGMTRDKKSPIEIVSDETRAELKNVNQGIRSVFWDFSASFALYYVKGKLLLRIFCENEVRTAFEKAFPEFEDYHYQNGTDRPKSISKKAWSTRRRNWEEALPHFLEFELWGPYDGPRIYSDGPWRKYTPTLAARAGRIAEELSRDAWFDRQRDVKKDVIQQAFHLLNLWVSEKKKPKQVKAFLKIKRRIEKILPKNVRDLATSPCNSLKKQAL